MTPNGVTLEHWRRVEAEIRGKMSSQQFDTWFKGVRLLRSEGKLVELGVPTVFTREWITRKYFNDIRTGLEKASGISGLEVTIVQEGAAEMNGFAPSAPPREAAPTVAVAAAAPPRVDGINALSADHTFDSFIVGPHNELAVAAAKSIVEHNTRIYNPLFVHGRVGLGKTHLLQAICHASLQKNPQTRIVYVSCEHFINQFISAVEKGDLEAFRRRYRQPDILVIDDVHFLAQKERSQEEFFHTFNSLHQLDRQIILSSDSPPPEIPTLSDRLVSRFKQGMVCELEPPLFETRLQIASRKADAMGVKLGAEILKFIAEKIQANVRELEGAVTRVAGHSKLMHRPVTLEMARNAMSDLLADRKRRVTLDDIVNVVTEHFGLRRSELQSKRRTKALTEPRQICMFLARKLTSISLEEIGLYFGGRDHSTVLYGADRVGVRLGADQDYRKVVEILAQQVGVALP